MQIEKSLFYQRVLFAAFWIRGMWSFFSDDVIPLMQSVQAVVFLLFDLVIMGLGIMLMTRKRDRIFALAFVVVTWLTSCIINGLTLAFYANGLREFIAYLFIIPIFNYFFSDPDRKARFVEAFDRQLFWFLLVQVPCVLFQFFLYRAGDMVGGSLGHWNSGVISTLIFAISFYLMKKRMDPNRYLASLWENKELILLLIPTQLNETKISFIYLVMYFLLLMPMNRTTFIRLLFAIPILGGLIWIAAVGYVVSTGGSMSDTFSVEYYAETYLYDQSGNSEAYAEALFDEGDDQGEDVPRFTKLMLLGDIDTENPGHRLTGFGVGHFKGGSVVDNSSFFKQYQWMMVGSIPYVFHVWIQLGVIGIVFMLLYFANLFNTHQPGQKRDYNIHFFFVLTFLMLLLYNDSFRQAIMCIPITYIIMLGWKDPEQTDATGELETIES